MRIYLLPFGGVEFCATSTAKMKELVDEMLGNEYGCAVANRFGGLLDDESDPFDVLYQTQVQQERKKKDEPKKPPAKSGKKAHPAASDRSVANIKAVSGTRGQL